jgi:hypothetical protein
MVSTVLYYDSGTVRKYSGGAHTITLWWTQRRERQREREREKEDKA